MKKIHIACCAANILFASVSVALSATCDVGSSFIQKDKETVNYSTGETKVFNRTVFMGDSILIFSEKMKVNTDGAVRSYGVKDITAQNCNPNRGGPSTGDPLAIGCAMNTVCNGFGATKTANGVRKSLKCSEKVSVMQELASKNWDTRRLPEYKFNFYGIAVNGSGKLCINVDHPDFFVSPASTQSGLGGDVCKQSKYMDAILPSIVVPRCWTKDYYDDNPLTCRRNLSNNVRPDVRSGDLVVLQRRDRINGPIFALVGDTGPSNKLGEISVGMAMKALGRQAPRYLSESYRLSDVALMDVIIFRGANYSGHRIKENWQDIEDQSKARFISWGGGSLQRAQDKLKSCGETVRSN